MMLQVFENHDGFGDEEHGTGQSFVSKSNRNVKNILRSSKAYYGAVVKNVAIDDMF